MRHSFYSLDFEYAATAREGLRRTFWGKTWLRWGVTITQTTLAIALTTMLVVPSARAAEQLTLVLGVAERSLDVDDLATFINTGEIPRSLRWSANRFSEEQLTEFRELMAKPFDLNPVEVSRFLNAPLGEALLDRLLILFRTTDPETTRKSLRAAIVLAAFEDGGASIINMVRMWPTRAVTLDFNVALEAVDEAKQLFVEAEAVEQLLRREAWVEVARSGKLPSVPSLHLEGAFRWQLHTIRFDNPARIGPSRIVADIYMPQDTQASVPLIVVSHGFASNRRTFAFLATHLASHGFAVAAIEHPSTSNTSVQQFLQGFLDPQPAQIFLQRPRDISLLLDELEQLDADGREWVNRIDFDRIGAIGHSLGGYTALAVGGATLDFEYLEQSCARSEQSLPFNLSLLLQCGLLQESADATVPLHDDRIDAVFAFNPVSGSLFGPEGMSQLQVPVTVVASVNDFFAPAVPEQVFPYAWAGSEAKYLAILQEGTHFSLTSGAADAASTRFQLPDEVVGPDPRQAHPPFLAMSTAFFDRYLRDRQDRGIYLSNVYLNTLPALPFTFSITDSLPTEDLADAIAAPLSEENVNFTTLPLF